MVLRILLIGLLASSFGCEPRERSASGFRLPENGDIESGKVAFVNLQCYQCHTVDGLAFPSPDSLNPPFPLGGEVSEVRTDGYLVTSIIHPSHKIHQRAVEQTRADGSSRMPDYGREMTVRELVDLVAFLHSRYRLRPPEPLYQ